MAADLSVYKPGDTVWVWYFEDTDLQYVPTSRVISTVDVKTSANEALVAFTTGNKITDGATPRIFTTEALAAAAIVTEVISATAAVVTLDATLSGASTASQASTTLVRQG